MKPLSKVMSVSMLAVALPFAAQAMADNPGAPSGGNQASAQSAATAQSETRFTREEERLIRDVLGAATGRDLSRHADDDDDDDDDDDHGKKHKDKNGKNGKNGKSKGLPPGIAKNLERGKPLPPGIAKRDLPDDLVSRLSKRSKSKATIVGDDVVLEDIATGVVLDVLSDVLNSQ